MIPNQNSSFVIRKCTKSSKISQSSLVHGLYTLQFVSILILNAILVSSTECLIHKSLVGFAWSTILDYVYHRVLYQVSKVCTWGKVHWWPRDDVRLLRIDSSKISACPDPRQSSSQSKPIERRYCTYLRIDLSKLEWIKSGLYYSG